MEIRYITEREVYEITKRALPTLRNDRHASPIMRKVRDYRQWLQTQRPDYERPLTEDEIEKIKRSSPYFNRLRYPVQGMVAGLEVH
jgi:hypothetical protein